MINLSKEKYTAYKKRGFTLIELIVVIVVIAVLVLLALPRFIGQTDKAHVAQIKNDVRVVESKVGEYLIDHGDLTKWGAPIGALDGDELYNKRGLIDSDNPITEGPFRAVPEEVLEEVKSHLDGTFYSSNLGEVYYSKEEFIGSPSYTDEEINDKIKLNYIPVATAEELNNVRSATLETYGKGTKWEGKYTGGLDKKYVQVANIDLSEYSEREEGWNPIGTDEESIFTGTYDGGNYVITELEVKGEGKGYQGLFGYAEGATISNVGLIDNKVTGNYNVGGLLGYSYSSTTISNSYTTGSVKGEGNVGGLVGYAYSEIIIENSYTTGSIDGASAGNVGGLVGYADYAITIKNSYATGPVEGSIWVGGLVGFAYSEIIIENSYTTGSIESIYGNVGGLVGWVNEDLKIINSYSTGAVTSSGSQVGGLVGYVYNRSTIENSYATGPVTGEYDVGGLVGQASGTKISNSYATGSVTGSVEGGYNIGGFVGYASSSTIENSYATGPVKGSGNNVGGFVGYTWGSNISNSYATGSVKGTGDVGGLVGWADNSTTIRSSYWNKETTGQEESAGGGTAKSTDDMKLKETYEGWDTDVWNIVNGEYPKLR